MIAVRNVTRIRIEIWQIMLFGALAVLILGEISLKSAFFAINYDVILFLFGTFVVGEALSQSGALIPLSERIFKRSKSPFIFFLILIFGAGLLSAVLMNDTVAIIGTFFVLMLSKKTSIPAEMLLLILAFSVTTGSVLSPVGNPQNLLIASGSGIENPFLTFAVYLLVPTLISLLLIYPVMRIFYPYSLSFRDIPMLSRSDDEENYASGGVPVGGKKPARIAIFSLGVLIFMIFLKILAGFLGFSDYFPLTAIALAGAVPVMLLSKKRFEIIKGIDWHTLVFFMAMFVLMQSVWDAGFIQGIFTGPGEFFSSAGGIFAAGIIVSQFISNVPFVALFMPIIEISGASESIYMALAAGSTLAGNFLLFGAASNIIIVQNAEKRGEKIGFLRFARVGIPLTLIQSAVYILWLGFI
ncbi:MAG: SLC13 family permease [Methanomicrobium sp.]|nr:SLC13 family permease [Methanomicrobium sp.]